LVPGLGGLSYEERLVQCKITTLERRRERGDMIDVFKIIHGYTKLDAANFFKFADQRHELSTRSAVNKCLVPEKCRLEIRKHFFANRVVQAWNDLPIEIREAETVNGFKNLYDDWMSNEQANFTL